MKVSIFAAWVATYLAVCYYIVTAEVTPVPSEAAPSEVDSLKADPSKAESLKGDPLKGGDNDDEDDDEEGDEDDDEEEDDPKDAERREDCKLKLATVVTLLDTYCLAFNGPVLNGTARRDYQGCQKCIARWNDPENCDEWDLEPEDQDMYKVIGYEIRKECCATTAWYC